MPDRPKRIAVFPGTFDPVTNGHIDIISRGRLLFDELIVAVGDNPDKRCIFSAGERVEMLSELVSEMPSVRVETYTGLTALYAKQAGAAAILRGIRNFADLQFELQLALTNREIAGIETVFIMPNPTHVFISSSLVRQVAAMGGDVSSLVPPPVAARLSAKNRRQGRGA